MLLFNIILAILAGVIFNDVSVSITALLFVLIGNSCIYLFSSKKDVHTFAKIYNVCFGVYGIYAIVCSFYMYLRGFDTMFVQDNVTAFIPYSMKLSGESFAEMWQQIYSPDNNRLAYNHCGWILIYFAYVIKLVKLFGSEVYVSLQFSMIFFSAFIPVFIYKLLRENNIHHCKKWTWLYAFLSILAYYSSLALRDVPIALCYSISIYYAYTKYSKRNILIMALMFCLTYGLRPQSALFLLLIDVIPLFRKNLSVSSIILLTIGGLVIVGMFVWLDGLRLYNDTQDTYVGILQQRQGASTLNSFNSLPPILSHLAKLIFIIISPIPSWAFMAFGDAATGPNNELGFTRAFAVIYNFIILTYALYGIFSKQHKLIPRNIWIGLFVGIAFILAQSNSIELRRIMACFPLLLLFAAKVSSNLSKAENRRVVSYAVAAFVVFQVIGMTKYL